MANNGGIYIPVTIGMDGAGDIALAQYKRIQTQFDAIYKNQLAKMKNSYRKEIQQLTNDIKVAQGFVDDAEKTLAKKTRGTASYREAKKELTEAQSILKESEKNLAEFNASLEKSAAAFANQQVMAKEAMASSSDSINGMTAKIKAYETELNSLAVGSQAWNQMAQQIATMKTELSLMSIQTKQSTADVLGSVQVYQMLGNTLSALEGQLAGWNAMLKDVEIGSQDFRLMASEAGKLDRAIAAANSQIKIFGSESKSMEQHSAILSDLSRKWQELGAARKFVNGQDAKAGYTAEAQALIDEFRATKEAAELTGDSLDQIISRERQLAEEAKRAGEQMAAALQKTRNIINSNVYSLDAMEARLRLLEKHHSKQRLFSSAWFETKAAIEQTTVELERARAQIQIMGTAAGSIDRLNLKIQQLRAQWNAMGAAQKFDASGKLTAQADALLTKYKQVTAELKKQGITLEELAGEEGARLNQLNAQASKLNFSMIKMLTRTAAFSAIFSAGRLVKHVREITAEFQLQQVSLGSIIQDMERAEGLFGQIKAAAIESPFEIKELVTYTKQLSAYQIETEKLFGTMMKLADVSAGLGVDMNRIILAYGQVKAASVLRGQELRQFTEAGIPLVDMLAKKLRDLRGEEVKQAEVFDMISKRLIPFSMIDEIFDDMTSAGGMFYKMQEKQAATLAGQWANLKDSVSIMYSEIGNTKAAFGAMEGMIRLLRKMTDNWKTTGNIINASLVALLAYKVATKSLAVETTKLTAAELSKVAAEKIGTVTVGGLTRKIIGKTAAEKLSTWATNQATKAYIRQQTATTLLGRALSKLWLTIMTNPYALAIGLVVGFGAAMIGLATRTKSATEAVDDLNRATEGYVKILKNAEDVNQLISSYEELSKKENKTAEETRKLSVVTKELSKQYPSAIDGINEETGALKLNIVELKHKNEEEQKIAKRRLEGQIREEEEALKKQERKRNRLANRLAKAQRTITYEYGGQEYSYESDFSDKKYERIAKRMDEASDNVDDLTKSLEDARKALAGLTGDGDAATQPLEGWRAELQKIKREVISTGKTIGVYSDSEIQNFVDIEEALADAAKQQKDYQQKADRARKAAQGKVGEEKKSLEAEAAQYQKNADAYMSVLTRWNATDLLDKSGKGGRKRLDVLMEEVSLLEKVYKKYQDYAKMMTKTEAEQKTKNYFKDTINDLRFGAAFTPEDLAKILLKYKALAKALPDSAKNVLELGFKADDALWEQEQERIERKLKDLADKISQSQTAKNFFNDILARTGDRQLAADMTISVYGEVGEDLKQNMIDQVKQAFAGVDVTSAINMDTLTINYRQLADIYSKNQDKILEKNRQTAKQLVDNGIKVSAEQIKAWYQEVEKAKTFATQRVELARRTAERIREINESNIPETEKQQLTRAYKAKEDKEAQRLAYEAFKNSPMYVQLFENLDNASTQMLTNMKKRLSDIKSEWKNLEPEQVKELTRRMQELDKQLAKRNPFKVLSDSIKEARDLGGLRAYNDAMDKAERAEQRRERSAEALEFALDNLTAAQKMYDATVKKHGANSVEATIAKQNLKNAQDTVDKIKEQAEATEDAANKAEELLGKWKDILENISKALGGLSDFVGKFKSIGESTTNLLSSIGVDEATVGHISDEINALVNTMASASQVAGGVLKVILGGDIVGGVVDIITGLIDTVSSVWDMFTGGTIYKANREIERQQKLLDNLEDSYSRLEKAQAKAFSTEYIQNYSQQLSNLEAQQAAYEAQAEAEKSKGKKSDEEKVAEYERAALDAQDQMVELKDSFLEKMAGTTLTSAAQEFAEAWIEAYKEFGSVTSAMSDKFNEMIQNMIVQSLAAKVMESILSPLFTQIDELAKDSELSAEDIALISKQVPDYINLINSGMQNMVNELGAAGLNLRTTGQGLTGISKDIANASEESILGLASGINTQNFYISQIHANVAQILLLMQGNGAQIAQQATAGTALQVDNPYITQYLPSIDQHTANIESYCAQTLEALNKVIKPSGSKGSHWVVTS